MAWIASLAQDGCDYVRLTGPIVSSITGEDPTPPYLEAGFNAYRSPSYSPETDTWVVQYTGFCTEYDAGVVEIDIYWTMAKMFAFISLVLGGGGALFLWFSSCFVFGPGTWRWAGYEVLAASIFQCLAFVWFGTGLCRAGDGSKCRLFFGSKSDIVATVFWFVSALFIFAKYPPPDAESAARAGNLVDQHGLAIGSPAMEIPVVGDIDAKMPAPLGDGLHTELEMT
eukprot:CAMPEP_0194382698 /NCGR_PEP_ID=MMETSP0174-20130528/62311_1 /TAXON_ID=216777 /ORGANISM="Proboscia alata, Strain PI-D3" /LENGTH=225 /DNA_ID=CAMNT_0039168221 /DNA_START=51 /DNA_END=728 /DNA_ORIENTATION=+